MKILVADDDITSRKILESTLKKWNFEVVTASNGKEAWEIIQSENSPKMIVLDWIMPGLDGLEICIKVRELVRKDYIYIILLTSKNNKEDIIKGLDSGADDYITKPFNPHELKARVNAGKRIIDLQTALNSARENLRFQANHDPLTKVFNRGALMDFLQRETARSYRSKKPLSVVMLDLDNFKNVNDTHGHIAGDEVLCKVSIRLGSTIRAYDCLGRYGGEEFLVVLPDCDKEQGLLVSERIRNTVKVTPIKTSKGMINITASVGLAVYDFDRDINNKVLVHAADAALYF